MNWTKDGDCHVAEQDGYSAAISKTYTCPPRPIPNAEKWSLEIAGPWYVCRCFPLLIDAMNAAERVIAALKEEE